MEVNPYKVLAVLPPQWRTLFLCLAWTGSRPAEMLALRWQDVDFDKKEITISKGCVRGAEHAPKTKSSNRTIPMLSIVAQALAVHRNVVCASLMGYVFVTKKGQPINKHLDRQWRVALRKAGITHRPSYQLRHTFALLCLQNGAEPGWVSKVLGHATLQTTYRHYARFIHDAAKENEKRVELALARHSNALRIGNS